MVFDNFAVLGGGLIATRKTCAVVFLTGNLWIDLQTRIPCTHKRAHYDRQIPGRGMTEGQSSIHEPSLQAGTTPSGLPLDIRRFNERHGIRYGYYASRQA
ncbi:hypothetical protein SPHV1_220021 [Novosphingobium sp. KN65.2]|nr:hypothetical protein SPHV1_220021 [Novosphingobium sp. KN65.2]